MEVKGYLYRASDATEAIVCRHLANLSDILPGIPAVLTLDFMANLIILYTNAVQSIISRMFKTND